LAEELDPDLILLDLNMQGMSGLETLTQLREKNITSRIVIFTVSDAQQDIIAALKLGADSYLLKDMDPEDMLASLQQTASGRVVLNDTISAIILDNIRNTGSITQNRDLNTLTPREKEVFYLLTQGLPNKLIARKLNI